MRKGQLEFIAILGIIVVIAVVGFYALQIGIINPVPTTPDTRLAQDSVNNFIRNAALDTLRKVSDNGGYLEPQASSVLFMGKSIPYWMRNGQVSVPNVQSKIIAGITNYINNNKGNFSASFSGKTVTLGQPQVTVNVLDNQLTISVYMPTTINGVQVPQPYSVVLPTKIGEAIDFSANLVQQQAQNRYLEYFILSSMLVSPYDGPSQIVPTNILLTSCGQFVFKTWYDVKPHLEDTIRDTLAHTYMPDKYPTGVEHTSSFLKYAIPEIGGKKHYDLNVSFELPDGFALTYSNFNMQPDPVNVIATVVPMVGSCTSEPVSVKYYIDFPTIVRVKDTITGNIMMFAIETYIKDNMPGTWGEGGYNQTIQAAICNALACDANVLAVDSSGNPVSGAEIAYMGCSLGQTNSNGQLAVKAPCGYGALNAYKNGFDVYTKYMDSSLLANANVLMLHMPNMFVHLYESIVEKVGGTYLQNGSSYEVNALLHGDPDRHPGVNPVNSFPERPTLVYLLLQNKATGEVHERLFDTGVGALNSIPVGEYSVSGMLVNDAFTQNYGSFGYSWNITEGLDGKDIYIYLPYSYEYSQLTDNTDRVKASLVLSSMLSSCGMGPINTTAFDISKLPCSRSFESL